MASTSESISPPRAIGILRGLLSSQRNFKRLQQIIIFIIMAIGAIAMIAPCEWMLATSFSRSANVAMPRIPRFWPSDPSVFNYKVAITNLPLIRYYLNSLIVTTTSTLGYLFFSSLTGDSVESYSRALGHAVIAAICFVSVAVAIGVHDLVRTRRRDAARV